MVAGARLGGVVAPDVHGWRGLYRETSSGAAQHVLTRQHFLKEGDASVIDAVDPSSGELLAVELGARRVDQMIAHRRRHRIYVLEVGMHVIGWQRLGRELELIAAEPFGLTRHRQAS